MTVNYPALRAKGICQDCDAPAHGKSRCVECAAYKNAQRRAKRVKKDEWAPATCSYCKVLGHNRRNCDGWKAEVARLGEVETLMRKRALEPLTDKNPAAWEVAAQKREQLRQVFEYIAALPPGASSAVLAIKAAKAALGVI